MQFNTIKKWGLIVGGVILALIMAVMIFVYSQITQSIDEAFGGKTEIANHAQFRVEAEPTAITNVSVLSPDGSEMLAGRTVLLEDGEIQSITENGRVPGGLRVIDGQGKFLIPGLTDSHAHLHRSPNDLLLYVATGVTQIRSMNGSKADLKLKSEIEDGRIGPHYYVSSPSMNSADGFGTFGEEAFPNWIPEPVAIWLAETMFSLNISIDARAAANDARAFIDKGHDGIKLYGFLTVESYRAILDVAEELDVPTVGHLPDSMSLSELRTTKLQEIAHIEEIVKALLNELGRFDDHGSDAFFELVESRKQEIIADLVANDIAVQSTLWFTESLKEQVFNLEAIIPTVEIEYANPGVVEGNVQLGAGWLPGNNKFPTYAGDTPEEIASNREFWNVREKAHHILLEAMLEASVTVLAGTDANGWLVVPGFSLHDELQSLTQAGMSPAEAIYSATAAPANRIRNNAGIIEAGRRADLVLLNKNPLDDIKNTSSIETVILDGKVFDRDQLDAMLEAVKEANASSRNFDLSLYQ